jgi:hypothetical protein
MILLPFRAWRGTKKALDGLLGEVEKIVRDKLVGVNYDGQLLMQFARYSTFFFHFFFFFFFADSNGWLAAHIGHCGGLFLCAPWAIWRVVCVGLFFRANVSRFSCAGCAAILTRKRRWPRCSG